MTDVGLACHATDCLGRCLPGRRDPGPDAMASRRDASGPPVDYFGDHGKEPGSTSDPGGHAVEGFPGWSAARGNSDGTADRRPRATGALAGCARGPARLPRHRQVLAMRQGEGKPDATAAPGGGGPAKGMRVGAHPGLGPRNLDKPPFPNPRGGHPVFCQVVLNKGDCGGNLGPGRDREEDHMHGQERRRLATGTFIKFDHSYAGTIAELGYPTRFALRAWWNEYKRTGEVPASRFATNPKHAAEMRRRAVEHYLEHGKSLARTTGALGYPKSREKPSEWVDELAPGRRRHRGPRPGREATPPRGGCGSSPSLRRGTGPPRR